MFGSIALEVALGIIFVFMLVSIICSSIREVIEAWFKTRAAYLEHGIRELLNDKQGKGLARHFYEHPVIFSLFSDQYKPGSTAHRPAMLANGGNLPSYFPSKNFALAIMDLAARGPITDEVSSHPDSPKLSLDTLRSNILNLNNPLVQRVLLAAIDASEGDINKVQKNLEAWYDSAMDRVSGWYKRATHWIVFWIALFVAVALNVNTITIADYLYRNDAARKVIVARAEAAAKDTSSLNLNYTQAKSALDSLNLPLGWSQGWGAPRRATEQGAVGVWNNILGPILGLLITALAATMGAPFWFDLLNKVMVIRSTVKPHEKSQEEASEDRQVPRRSAPGVGPPVSPATAVAGAGTVLVATVSETDHLTGVSNIRDEDSNVDACDVEMNEDTPDDQLPPAEGGVD